MSEQVMVESPELLIAQAEAAAAVLRSHSENSTLDVVVSARRFLKRFIELDFLIPYGEDKKP